MSVPVTHSLRRLLSLTAIAGAFVLGTVAPAARAGPVEDALNAALNGPPRKHLGVFGHVFHVYPVEIIGEGDRTTVIGQITHRRGKRGWRDKLVPDDQVYYTIVK